MSINSALLAGVSGLVANSSALAAISDNIANVNTVAYKRNQVNFANVVTAQAVKGKYSAGGVQGITRQFVSQQGLIQAPERYPHPQIPPLYGRVGSISRDLMKHLQPLVRPRRRRQPGQQGQ